MSNSRIFPIISGSYLLLMCFYFYHYNILLKDLNKNYAKQSSGFLIQEKRIKKTAEGIPLEDIHTTNLDQHDENLSHENLVQDNENFRHDDIHNENLAPKTESSKNLRTENTHPKDPSFQIKTSSDNLSIFSNPNSKNLINDETIFIFNAYFIRKITKENPSGVWKIRATAFANCHIGENYTYGPIFVENSYGRIFEAKMYPTDGKCYARGWTPGCTWGPFLIDTMIMDEDAKKIGDKIKISFKNRQIEIPLRKVLPRLSGLSVCVNPMYWFVDWPKLIEFIEIYRILGASKFYLFYQSVTKEVYEVFKEYEKMGIVDLVKAEVMPKNKEGFNPDSQLFRIGYRTYQNDCVMRSKTKFMAMVDVDEIILPQNNITLIEFLENETKNNPIYGAFYFQHAALRFDAEKMPHLHKKKEDFDWKSLNFSWLETAEYAKMYKMGKTISITDRVDVLSTHYIQKMQWGYKQHTVPYEKGVYYHPRINWVAKNASESTAINSTLYEPKLKSFFTKTLQEKIHKNYVEIMKNVEKNLARKPVVQYEVFPVLKECLRSWRSKGCSPYFLCAQNLSSAYEWVYANPSPYETSDLNIL